MAIVVNDTFTQGADGYLTAHTPETGGAWTAHPDSSVEGNPYYYFGPVMWVDAATDEVYGGAPGANIIRYNAATPADNAQRADWTLVRRGAYNTGQGIRMYLRMSTGTLASGSALSLWLSNNGASSMTLYLYKYVSGALTGFSTGVSSPVTGFTMTQNAEVMFRTTLVGTRCVVETSTDGGSNWTTQFDLTDASVTTQVGKLGIAQTDISPTSTNGINITKVTFSDAAAFVTPAAVPVRRSFSAFRGVYTR